MKKIVVSLAFLLVSGVLSAGCGGDDDDKELTPVEACEQVMGVLCDKFFDCLTQEQLTALSSVVGLNSADCKTKFIADSCSTTNTMCDSGETYNASAASQCLDGYKAYSCNNILGYADGSTPDPAICDQVCARQ